VSSFFTVTRTIAAAALLVGCGSLLRTVPSGPHPSTGAEAIIVEYPPPPAQQEPIEGDPGEPCMWEDGYWTWLGRRWSWQPGRWVLPPPGCYFAGPMMAWAESTDKGELYYMLPRWYPTNAEELDRSLVLKSCQSVKPCGKQTRAP
jgi:hypothetical protein